jgi:hypothetical protein
LISNSANSPNRGFFKNGAMIVDNHRLCARAGSAVAPWNHDRRRGIGGLGSPTHCAIFERKSIHAAQWISGGCEQSACRDSAVENGLEHIDRIAAHGTVAKLITEPLPLSGAVADVAATPGIRHCCCRLRRSLK